MASECKIGVSFDLGKLRQKSLHLDCDPDGMGSAALVRGERSKRAPIRDSSERRECQRR